MTVHKHKTGKPDHVGTQAEMDDAKGEAEGSWIVDYVDQSGERHIQTFDRKKEADDYHATVKVDVGKGIHTPQSKSLTVAEAAEDWIKYVELEKRERSTVEHYRNHVDIHINPRIGREKLAKLTTPRIQAFRDDLLASLSRAQAKKVLTSLKIAAARRDSAGATWRRTSRSDVSIKHRQARQGEAEGRRRYSDPGRDQAHRPRGNRPGAPDAGDRHLHRPAQFRVARPALGRRGPQEGRTSRSPARRPVQRDRQAQIRSGERTIPLGPLV